MESACGVEASLCRQQMPEARVAGALDGSNGVKSVSVKRRAGGYRWMCRFSVRLIARLTLSSWHHCFATSHARPDGEARRCC